MSLLDRIEWARVRAGTAIIRLGMRVAGFDVPAADRFTDEDGGDPAPDGIRCGGLAPFTDALRRRIEDDPDYALPNIVALGARHHPSVVLTDEARRMVEEGMAQTPRERPVPEGPAAGSAASRIAASRR